MSSTAIQRKDEDGLTLEQRRLLQELAIQPDWRAACDAAEVPYTRFRSWMQHNQDFQFAYDSLLQPAVSAARDMIEAKAVKAAGMYDEALDALKMLDRRVVCPCPCNHEFTISEEEPDWNARLKAGDTILKVSRILVNRSENLNVSAHLDQEELLAYAKYQYELRQGVPITVKPQMIERLRAKGKTIEVDPSSVKHVVDSGVQS